MNKKLISEIKSYVNILMLPLEKNYYHHYGHALAVMERAVYLGTMEGCSQDEVEMLAIAALFHDTGFVIEYDNNEIYGSKIARNFLKTVLYPPEKIKIIENIIIATTPSVKPKNLLEEIIKDADMDNLGTDEFFTVSEKLKSEREMIQDIKIRDPEWRHASLDIIEGFHYFTGTQRSERQKKLMENIEKLKTELGKK